MIIFAKAHPATRTMRGGDPTPEQAASGKYPKERMPWKGLTIAIEHPEGTVREGVDETGKPWRTVFRYAYGEILGTTGLDGDPIDVFIGSYPDAPEVYIVQQMKRKDWDKQDEQKCMINFASVEEAMAAYLGHYDDPRFFGGITAMPVAEFVAKVRATKDKPAMIKAILFFKSHVGPYLRGGKIVNVAGYQGRAARPTAWAGQRDLFDADEHGEMPPARRAQREPQHTEPTRELIAEHERLVDVLNSPSHEDDKVEANKQAKELAGYKEEAGEHDHLLEQIPGAKWRRGKGAIAHRYAVELNGDVVGNYHDKPEDAIGEAKQWIANKAKWAQEADENAQAIVDLRGRLLAGGEPTEGDLALLGLRHNAGLKWFIPAAAKVFGITSHAVRPHIKDLVTVARSDFGVAKEFVNTRRGLQAIAADLAEKPKPAYKPVTDDNHPAPIPRSLLSAIPEDQREEWKDLHRQQHELHHYELGQVREKLARARTKRNKAQEALRSAESGLASLRGAPIHDTAREAEAQKHVDKTHADYIKVDKELDALINAHNSLYEKVAKLGRQKERIYPGSGDMDRDFASLRQRTASEQQEHEKGMLKRYREHYKQIDAEVTAAKSKPAPKPHPTETTEFKRWFGNSKVRNDDGTPKVLYHGTPHDFSEFKPGGADPSNMPSGHAIWMSPDADHQPAAHNIGGRDSYREGTNVMPVYVKMERPLHIDDKPTLEWARKVFAGGSMEFPQLMPKRWMDEVTRDGEYDGIIFDGEALGWGKGTTEYLVFDPRQVKSAIGNSGAFDPDHPGITKSMTAPILFVRRR